MSTEIEVNNCFVIMTFHLRMKILLLSLLLLKICLNFKQRHLTLHVMTEIHFFIYRKVIIHLGQAALVNITFEGR